MADDRGENGDGGGEDEVVLRERQIDVTISGDGSDENEVMLGVVKNRETTTQCRFFQKK
jgi:hypothetical protein